MAYYTATLATLKAAVAHVLAGTPTGTNALDTTDVCNRALQYLASVHPWTWLQRSLSLDLTASQAYANLPADFSQLLALRRTSGAFNPVLAVTYDELLRMREGNIGTTGTIYFAIGNVVQASQTALPTRRLEIFPTPASTESGALAGLYVRELPTLTSDTHVPDVPGEYHPALRTLCRAFAASDELEVQGPDWAMWQTMLPDLQARDGAVNSAPVMMRGGLRGGPVTYRPHSSITA